MRTLSWKRQFPQAWSTFECFLYATFVSIFTVLCGLRLPFPLITSFDLPASAQLVDEQTFRSTTGMHLSMTCTCLFMRRFVSNLAATRRSQLAKALIAFW
jgi:hypothetical protein